MYSKESLELLRHKIDIVEVISQHIPLKRSGSSYKACCPFHDEKTPSFIVNKGDSHYHCFGCGAHGDAFSFLMSYAKWTFSQAIEFLAEKFNVQLEKSGDKTPEGPSKQVLRRVLDAVQQLYHFNLLHTAEGHEALNYLYERGIDLEFIQRFGIGYAPNLRDFLLRSARALDASWEDLENAGLIHPPQNGSRRDFFYDRILFPIRDPMGHVIGFSGRKFREETHGGKYVNTPETVLFKKSHVLFGLSYCRQKIAKDRKALIVEGQIDALRLIYEGFDYCVAGQGTAFGDGHASLLLQLGVIKVYLALDGDKAGREAAVKIGDIFQKKGVEVLIVPIPEGKDPDALVREKGPQQFADLIAGSIEYLPFLIAHYGKGMNSQSPSEKNSLVQKIRTQVLAWEQPVMVHETLRKLAQLTQVPEEMVLQSQHVTSIVPRFNRVNATSIDGDKILEMDVLRWLVVSSQNVPELVTIARKNLSENDFKNAPCRELFSVYFQAANQGIHPDILQLGAMLEKPEEHELLSDLLHKKIHLQKAHEGMREAVKKILTRNWMEQREVIRQKMQSGMCSEEEVLLLAKEFDTLKRTPPEIVL